MTVRGVAVTAFERMYMRKLSRVFVGLGLLALVAAAVAYGSNGKKSASDTLVFASSADPVALDGALISDGESGRVIIQIYEGLVALKPGTTTVVPSLATKWKASPNGKQWTFTLRQGVKFSDGTPIDAAAVCYNFDRWYNFTGSFQNPSATYYWQTVFGGFKTYDPKSGAPKGSLFASCKTRGTSIVTITLTAPSAAFLGALSLPSFFIGSPTAMQKYGADQGSVDASGVFHPTGTYATAHPTGTGPFMLQSWTRGDKLVLVRNPNYWGKKAILSQLIFRPIADNAARLQALQNGEIQGYDLVEPQDVPTIKGDSSLKLLSRPPFNVGIVGMNQSMPPMNNIKVRQALAYGLDRADRGQGVLRRSRSGGEGVSAAEPLRLLEQRQAVPVQPGEGEGAAEVGRAEAAGDDQLLVSDERLAPVHAGPGEELPGILGEPDEVRVQGRPARSTLEPRLPRWRPGRQGTGLPLWMDR